MSEYAPVDQSAGVRRRAGNTGRCDKAPGVENRLHECDDCIFARVWMGDDPLQYSQSTRRRHSLARHRIIRNRSPFILRAIRPDVDSPHAVDEAPHEVPPLLRIGLGCTRYGIDPYIKRKAATLVEHGRGETMGRKGSPTLGQMQASRDQPIDTIIAGEPWQRCAF